MASGGAILACVFRYGKGEDLHTAQQTVHGRSPFSEERKRHGYGKGQRACGTGCAGRIDPSADFADTA
jgi:hypothetical protein